MAGFFGWIRSIPNKARARASAKRAELSGDLARAIELYAEAGESGEAARVMLLRADTEGDARVRLQGYAQASALAPAGHPVGREARLKRADLVMAVSEGAPIDAVKRSDLRSVAADLEALGENERAARAYALAGDGEGRTRALMHAGKIEELEEALATRSAEERRDRACHEANAEIDMLVAAGRRRDALALAESSGAHDRADDLRRRRATGPRIHVTVRDRPLSLVLGDEIVVGRTEGALTVSSIAVSRRQVRITRDEMGSVCIEDLESRNGTTFRGMRIAGKLPVGEGVDVKLGNEVTLSVRPSQELAGGVVIDLAGTTGFAPLGPARLGIGDWSLELADDGWIELVSGNRPAFMGDVELVPRVSLLLGDAIGEVRGGLAVLQIGR